MKKEIFKDSLAVAEAIRDKTAYSGFMGGIFEADARWRILNNLRIPSISAEAKKIIADFRALLTQIDSEAIDRDREIPQWIFDELKRLSIFGAKIPKMYGGIKFSQYEYQTLATLCGSADASLTVLISAAQSIGVPEPLRIFGTDEQKQKYLPRLANGEISGFALTEPEVGCDISKVKTYAVRIKKFGQTIGYCVTGQKFFITNAPKDEKTFLASMLVVVARIVDDPMEMTRQDAKKNYGAFIIETNSPGCSVERLHFNGVRAIYNGAPKFQNVFVPAENLLGNENDGLRIALTTLTTGRLTLPAACLGGMKRCLASMRWWGEKRAQWGKSISNHTMIGEMICRTASRTLALEAVMAFCAAMADNNGDVRIESAASKTFGAEWYWDAVNDLVQIRGGRGFMETSSQKKCGEVSIPAMRMLQDARINLIWEGTSQILRLWMMREMFANYLENQKKLAKGTLSEKILALWHLAQMGYRAFGPNFSKNNNDFSDIKNKHAVKFVKRAVRNLTRAGIYAMLSHKEKLINEQLILKELADDAMNVFAMTAVAWYVSQPNMLKKPHITEFADYFYNEAKQALYPSANLAKKIRQLAANNEKINNLVKLITKGECAWLEEGALTFLEEQNQPPV